LKNLKWGIAGRKAGWLIPALLIPTAIVLAAFAVMSWLGNPYTPTVYGKYIPIPIILLACIVGATGEEIGWRGFVLPTFLKKHTLLISGLFTGLLWGGWHVTRIGSIGALGFLLLVVGIVELSIIMSWIYSRTNGSLLPGIVVHYTLNVTTTLLIGERAGVVFYLSFAVTAGVICAIVVLANRELFFSKITANDRGVTVSA
jgi:membrane protease YdiL (CAAX protease family)